jgi:Cft2 family RNA processing exonuclease
VKVEYLPLGGAGEVGASCGLLCIGDRRVLIDAGMRPSARAGQDRLPALDRLAAEPPEAILVTHAHIDHTGALPLASELFPTAPIYCTETTLLLMRLLLADSVRVMEAEHLAQEGETPLYTAEVVERTLARVRPVEWGQPIAPLDDPAITVRFLHAGHIAGAAMLLIDTPAGRVLHMGDYSVTAQRTLHGLDVQRLPQADAVITEGTYGDAIHANRKEQERALVATVARVVGRGGRALLPAFAVGRAQEVALILRAARSTGELPPVPIHLDGMVRGVCDLYQAQVHDLNPRLQNYVRNARRPLFADPSLAVYAVTAGRRRQLLNDPGAAIVISSSGMMTGGPAPLYARAFAADEKNAIVFSGYQDDESPGAALLRARQGTTVTLGKEELTLSCAVERYSLSAHADASQIEVAVTRAQPRVTVLVHGEPDTLRALAKRVARHHPYVAANGEVITLIDAPVRATAAAGRPATTAPSGEGAHPSPTVAAGSAVMTESLNQKDADPSPADLSAVHRAALAAGGLHRPWTTVELARLAVGARYTPATRVHVQGLLDADVAHFARKRLGAQDVYLPRAPEDVAKRQATHVALTPGDLVIARMNAGQGEARLGVITSVVEQGTVDATIVGWKGERFPLAVIQLPTGVRRPAYVALAREDRKAALAADQERIDAATRTGVIAYDLMTLWAADGAGQTTADLLGTQETDDGRLALARDLVMRGGVLFTRHGDVWEPKVERDLAAPEAVARHLALLARGPRAEVVYRDGRQGLLSGRGRWGQVEVVCDDETRVWWQDKDVQAVGSSVPERATGDGADDAVVATADGVDDDQRAG